jgi:fructose 1,6-bisphosphatase
VRQKVIWGAVIFIVAPAYFVLTSGWLRGSMDGRLLPACVRNVRGLTP